ncbi:hypothetical protein Taro_041617 [Colocasia esculenta]|uniref:IRK-interacting protein n=1 Tax=Colocasia esculenta TaxID=4460 RepID=A0A843WU35_COLES|nr:hypothetical protein [Colocasia esculenta]
MASPSSSASHPPPPPPVLRRPRFRLFTTLPDRQQEEEDEAKKNQHQQQEERPEEAATATYEHLPTPLRPATPPATSGAAPKRTRHAGGAVKHVVSYNKCRPSTREKISVVPLDVTCGGGHGRSQTSSSDASPANNGVLKSFFSALTWRSPHPSCSSPSAARPYVAVGEEEWRLAATELSRRLIHATRKRDEALAETSRLKYSVADLERKLAGLESYCRDLKSNLDHCNHKNYHRPVAAPVGSGEFPLEPFLRAVSDSRSAIRHLSHSLVAQMSRDGDPPKAHGRLLQLIQQEGRRTLSGGGGSDLLFHVEALLSRTFYEDFELAGFHRIGSDGVLDPRARAEANMAGYAALRGLSWDDVLSRGTRHYSEGFSRFCDRKMGEVAASALGGGWCGAWPEPLLRAFFEAAKGVWLVHLLAWSAHPPVPVFRVDKGAPFDAGYMDEVAPTTGKGRPPAPVAVRMMLAPGFYALGGVVKCRVLCMHSGSKGNQIGSAKARVDHGHSDGSINEMRTHRKA